MPSVGQTIIMWCDRFPRSQCKGQGHMIHFATCTQTVDWLEALPSLWLDYSQQKSADSQYNPYKWCGPQTPLEMFHPPPPFHDKAVQSNILWLNLNKIDNISILQSAHEQGHPSSHFHAPGSKRRYPRTQTASAVQKYFPCLLQFCTGYRIWHASRVWVRKMSEKRWFSHS